MVAAASAPYRPWGTAEDVFYSRARRLIVSGPAGTGKSRAILEKHFYLACKYARLRVLWVRKTRKALSNSALVTFEEHVLPEGSRIASGAGREHRTSYEFPNGSTIVVMGLDDNSADKVMSTEWDLIYVQEGIELDEEAVEKLDMRLRNARGPYHQLVIDTNPGPPTHWLLEWEKRGYATMIHSDHRDNPRLFDHRTGDWTAEGREYLASLDAKKGHLRDRYLLGKWVQPEGSRWPELDEQEHGFRFRERFPHGIPQSWKRVLGVDYGLRAPYAALWLAIDHDGDIWAYRERYSPGLKAWEQAEEIVKATSPGEKVSRVRMDPAMWQDFPGHEVKSGKSAADYYEQVLGADPRFGPIEQGFNRSRMLGQITLDNLFARGNEYPNLRIETSLCPNLWAELTGAVWSDKERKEDIDEKCPDHAITALIYATHNYLDRPEVLSGAWSLPAPEAVLTAKSKEQYDESVRSFENQFKRSRTIQL